MYASLDALCSDPWRGNFPPLPCLLALSRSLLILNCISRGNNMGTERTEGEEPNRTVLNTEENRMLDIWSVLMFQLLPRMSPWRMLPSNDNDGDKTPPMCKSQTNFSTVQHKKSEPNWERPKTRPETVHFLWPSPVEMVFIGNSSDFIDFYLLLSVYSTGILSLKENFRF